MRYSRIRFQIGIVLIAIPLACDIVLVGWLLIEMGATLYDAAVA